MLGGCPPLTDAVAPYPFAGRILDAASGEPVTDVVVAVSPVDYWQSSPTYSATLDRLYGEFQQTGQDPDPFGISLAKTTQMGQFAGEFLVWVNDREPAPIWDDLHVYVRSGQDWLSLTVPLDPGHQPIGADGLRHIALPDIYLSANGLSLTPAQ
jgi:hypothetical protein